MRETLRGSCLPRRKRNLAAINPAMIIAWRLASLRRRCILFAPRNPTYPKRINESSYVLENDSHPIAGLHHIHPTNAATKDARRAATRRASAGTIRDRDAEDTQREHPQAARRRDA